MYVMETIDKILNLLKMKNNTKSYSVKFYAEMKLDDGRIIATEDDQFMIGSKVFAVNDDGEAEALAAGSYTMENGNKMTIDEESRILDLGEEKEAEDIEAKEENEEMSEENKEETKEELEEAKEIDLADLEKRISKLEKDIEEMGYHDKEDMSKEDDKTEMSADIIGELMTQVEDLNTKITELSEEPATEEIKYNPEGDNVNVTVDLTKLSAQERAAYYINNLK